MACTKEDMLETFANMTVMVDFPTPPLPDMTAMIFLMLFLGFVSTEQVEASLLQFP